MSLAQALHDAGLPPGVLNLINGDAATMAQVLLDDPRCRKIGFTGSTRVGRLLLQGAAKTFTRLGLELGGNAGAIVDAGADLETRTAGGGLSLSQAADRIVLWAEELPVPEGE